MYIGVCMCILVYVYLCVGIGVCMYFVSMCVCVRMSLYIIVCIWLHVTSFQTSSCDPNSVAGDSNLCSLWTQYTGDSKTNP